MVQAPPNLENNFLFFVLVFIFSYFSFFVIFNDFGVSLFSLFFYPSCFSFFLVLYFYEHIQDTDAMHKSEIVSNLKLNRKLTKHDLFLNQ